MKRTHASLAGVLSAAVLVFSVAFALAAPAAALAQQDSSGAAADASTSADSSEQIRSFDTRVEVHADATARVTENIAYDFGDQYKHGIYRDIPVDYRAADGSPWSLTLSDISVVDENGAPYRFSVYSVGVDQEIKIGDPDNTITGVHDYIISYTVNRPIGYFKGFDEIYWNATGNEWQVPIDEASATVILPQAVAESSLQTSCYYGPTGSTARCDDSRSIDGAQVSFTAPGTLDAGSGLTVAVGFPKGIVAAPTASQLAWYGFLDFIYGGTWLFIMPVIVFIFMFRRWWKRGRAPKGSGVIIAHYEAPDGLLPMQTRFVLSQAFGPSLSAEIISLATRGYLKINRIDGDYELVRLKTATVELTDFDRQLIDGLFGSGQSLSNTIASLTALKSKGFVVSGLDAAISELASEASAKAATSAPLVAVRLSSLKYTFSATVQDVEASAQTSLVEGGYFKPKKAGSKVPLGGSSRSANIFVSSVSLLMFGSIIGAVFIGNLVSSQAALMFVAAFIPTVIIVAVFSAMMSGITEKGVAAKEAIKGLKLYLSVAEKDRLEFHDAPAKSPEVFEKLLPYAIALGVEKQWAKVFEGITLAQPTWYNDPNMHSFNAIVFASSISAFSSAGNSTLRSTPPSAPGSSSGSSGGGFSGGGGGGGGGGSW